MKRLYTFLLSLALPAVLLRLLWRSRKQKAYRYRLGERLGFYSCPRIKHSLWFHTVSVGEFLTAMPLIKALQQRYPDRPVVVTTTTPTASSLVQKHLGDQVTHVYTPYDLPWILGRFLRHMQPEVVVIVETELWPNLLSAVSKRGIPLLLANARLSERSKRGYSRISKVAASMMQQFSLLLAQNAVDGQRFVDLGLPQARLRVAGNIKFDVTVPEGVEQRAQQLRQQWRADSRIIITVASTHDGEEALILKALAALHDKGYRQRVLMLLVPRHPDRFDEVYRLCSNAGFNVSRRSANQSVEADTDIALGDTLGEMQLFCAASDMAFFGGSFVPVGGHNLIEAAMFAKPVLSGPHMHNFALLREQLLASQALMIAQDPMELADQCRQLIDDAGLRQAMGLRAQQVVEANRGALQVHVDCIAELL